jgi:hypothetical protein
MSRFINGEIVLAGNTLCALHANHTAVPAGEVSHG